jgi:2,3-bisphosphoglycerate-dependent phosphoglycerate mutase
MIQDPLLIQRAQATELHLIRHGEAIPGADELIPSGIYHDLPLSKEGREQAHKLAERLKTTHFDTAYSSPLQRCLQTGKPLLTYLQLEPTIVEDLREVHTTNLTDLPKVREGESLEELAKALRHNQNEITRLVATQGHWDGLIHGETSKEFRQRVVNAIDTIVANHIGQRVLVFCHGGVINAYAAEVLHLERDFFFPTINTSITVVRANTDTRVLYIMNDVAHLF